MTLGCQTLSILSGKGTLTTSENRPEGLIAAQLPETQLPATSVSEAALSKDPVSQLASQSANATESTLQQASFTANNTTNATAAVGATAVGTTIVGPGTKPNEQQALQQVMPDLQALLAEDPAAHAVLIEEFGKTDPSMWSALTRRARSKVAYQRGVQVSSTQQSQLQLAISQQAAGEQAIVQQLANQVAPIHQGISQQSGQLPSQMLANQLANSSMAPQPTSGQATPNQIRPNQISSSQPVALPKPDASREQTNVAQVSHTTNVAPTNQVSNSHWIDNQHVPNGNEQPNRNTASVTVNPYAATPNSTSNQLGQEGNVRVASISPAAIPKAPTPQVIENMAYERTKSTDWRKSLETAIDVMKSNTPEQPVSTEEAYRHARLRLLQLAAGKEEEAFDSIPGLSSTEQSYWSKQIYSMATLMDIDQQVDRKRRATSAAIHQSEALTQLRKMGTLQIRNLGFCSEIYGFGAYEPIPQPKFMPGAEASLYTEIENYRSDSTERGFHTLVATSYRVEDKSGSLVDEGEFPVVEDYCLSQRRDFHITYGVTLPTAIYPGEYHLKLTITDQLGDKIGEDSVPFEIIAQ